MLKAMREIKDKGLEVMQMKKQRDKDIFVFLFPKLNNVFQVST